MLDEIRIKTDFSVYYRDIGEGLEKRVVSITVTVAD